MEILTNAFGALWQVAAAGLLLGAGLPILFALGVRSLDRNRVGIPVVMAPEGTVPAGEPTRTEASQASVSGKAGAALCFGLCVIASLFGIVVIVFGKQMFG
ncbi:MAG: hypothetical protein L0H41_05150 [Microlunatus sp.]|nr:hypothetical protein [Microlunatus sp.]MDN5769700.1 hypothetical protein [Microlunatus sp.]MDN5805254.1 hypothetical protein [Microlunatus sp.]